MTFDPDSRPAWKQELAEAVRDPAELAAALELPDEAIRGVAAGQEQFRLVVPRSFLRRIKPGHPRDPLLLQVLPQFAEVIPKEGFTDDPLGEAEAGLGGGVLGKYASRRLIVATPVCAVHCRFCFRRHFPYETAREPGRRWQAALETIARDDTVDEVILSGGDPLTLDDRILGRLVDDIATIEHVRRLRIHTRMPVVIPSRVDDAMIAWLRGTRLTPFVVVHANHPREIDGDVANAFARFVDSGVPLLSQTVLLRDVNDDVDTLETLFRRLIDLRVIPYYLHQLDRVAGAAHFEIAVERGLEIIDELRRRLPGYAVPRYVQETPGQAHKTPLG